MVFNKVIDSCKNINYKLFFALLFLGFCPTIYTTIRIFFLGQLPNAWAYSIAGQLSWVNLLYEILNEAIILPLFYFTGQVKNDCKEFGNRIKTGLIVTLIIYTLFSLLIICFTKPLMQIMAVDKSILQESITYIRIESIANIFLILCSFTLVALVSLEKHQFVYLLTIVKLILSIVCDTFLLSSLPSSLNLGVNGIGCSNIIVNVAMLILSIFFYQKLMSIFSLVTNYLSSGLSSFLRLAAFPV